MLECALQFFIIFAEQDRNVKDMHLKEQRHNEPTTANLGQAGRVQSTSDSSCSYAESTVNQPLADLR